MAVRKIESRARSWKHTHNTCAVRGGIAYLTSHENGQLAVHTSDRLRPRCNDVQRTHALTIQSRILGKALDPTSATAMHRARVIIHAPDTLASAHCA